MSDRGVHDVVKECCGRQLKGVPKPATQLLHGRGTQRRPPGDHRPATRRGGVDVLRMGLAHCGGPGGAHGARPGSIDTLEEKCEDVMDWLERHGVDPGRTHGEVCFHAG